MGKKRLKPIRQAQGFYPERNRRIKRGLFITFEGPEGCGKSTHSKLLHKHLLKSGFDCVFVREPGGTQAGDMIRKILLNTKFKGKNIDTLTELLLFEASRNELIDKVIKPSLKKKKIVLCDRYNDSTIVYQSLAGGVDTKKALIVDGIVVGNVIPDITILIDLNEKLGLKRACRKRKKDRMELKSLLFHKKVRKGFLSVARKNKKRVCVIKNNASIAELQGRIKDAIDKKVKKII